MSTRPCEPGGCWSARSWPKEDDLSRSQKLWALTDRSSTMMSGLFGNSSSSHTIQNGQSCCSRKSLLRMETLQQAAFFELTNEEPGDQEQHRIRVEITVREVATAKFIQALGIYDVLTKHFEPQRPRLEDQIRWVEGSRFSGRDEDASREFTGGKEREGGQYERTSQNIQARRESGV